MSMHLARLLTLLLATMLLLAGCSTDSDDTTTTGTDEDPAAEVSDEPEATVAEEELLEGDVEPVTLELEQVNDSGVSGTVTVGPTDSDAISIDLQLDEGGEQTRGLQAAKGSCEDAVDPGAIDAALETVSAYTLPDIEDGAMQDEVELPEEVVGEGLYSLIVYEGAEDEGDIAACVAVEVE